MALVTCPKCSTENSGDARYCVTCGASLSGVPRIETKPAMPIAQGPSQAPIRAFSTYSPPTFPATSYAALRGIASFREVLGWIVIGLAGVNAMGGPLALRDAFLLGVSIIILSVVSGGVISIVLHITGGGTSVFLDSVANTRRMAYVLEERLRSWSNSCSAT